MARAKGRRGIRSRLGEAAIEAGQKLRQIDLGAGAVRDPGEAEFATQSILEGPEESLDATFRLRTAGGDPADAEFGEGAGDLCGRGFAGKLLGEREGPLRATVEDAVAVAVDSDRQARGVREGLEQSQIAMRILSVAEGGGEDSASRVVDRREEDQARAAVFEPVMRTPVDLHQHPGLRHPFPTSSVTWRAPASGAVQTRRPEDAMDCGVR